VPAWGGRLNRKFLQRQRGKSLGIARQMAIKADPTIAKNVGLSISRKRELDQADDAKRNRLRTHSDSVSLTEYRRVSEENDQLLQHIAKLKANSVIL
jgi:hypothetical protein